MRVGLAPREPPLPPAAVVARGLVVPALLRRLLSGPEAATRLHRLSAVAGPEVLAVLGEAADLPWVEGLVYLGRDPEAPLLYLPTCLKPTVPASLFERALRSTHGLPGGPLAVLDAPPTVFSLSDARALTPGAVERCLAGRTRAVASQDVAP